MPTVHIYTIQVHVYLMHTKLFAIVNSREFMLFHADT